MIHNLQCDLHYSFDCKDSEILIETYKMCVTHDV